MSSVSRLPSRLPTTGHSEITTSQKSLTIPTSQKSSMLRTNLKPPSTISKPSSSLSPPQSGIQSPTTEVESSPPNHSAAMNTRLRQPLKLKNDSNHAMRKNEEGFPQFGRNTRVAPYDPTKLSGNGNIKSNPPSRTLFNLKKSNSLSVRSSNVTSTEVDNLRTENSQLRIELEKLRAEQAKILAENEQLKTEKMELMQGKERDLAQYRNELEIANNLIIEQSTTMTEQQSLIEELMAQLDEQEQVCQDLHNMIDTFKAKQNLSTKEVENNPKVQITKDDCSTVQA